MAQQPHRDPQDDPRKYAYGSNSQGAKRIFQERQYYDHMIFPDNLIPNFIDSWHEDSFYGLVNSRGNACLPEESLLKPLRYSADETQYALGFVADAWRDLSAEVRRLANQNILFRNSVWSKIEAISAWKSVDVEYDLYMRENVFPVFNEMYLGFAGRDGQITDIHDFLRLFGRFYFNVIKKSGPLTVSGLVEGSYLSNRISGLSIEIGKDPYDDDYTKSYKYKDANFLTFAEVARKYGFLIDKNIPWRLTADITSPVMQEYMYGIPLVGIENDPLRRDNCDKVPYDPELVPDAYGYSQVPGMKDVLRHMNVYPGTDGTVQPGYPAFALISPENSSADVPDILFASFYRECWLTDVGNFRKYLLAFYNGYVENLPMVTVKEPRNPHGGCRTVAMAIERHPITTRQEVGEFYTAFGQLWALKTFYQLRRAERGISPSGAKDLRQFNKSKMLYDTTQDYEAALRYTQESFIGPWV
mgnify:CR=1 FL=1|tara:strand:+ start:1845 stop:3260 length:1416 start_codon:yes stop_codon:yes gene_type:complete